MSGIGGRLIPVLVSVVVLLVVSLTTCIVGIRFPVLVVVGSGVIGPMLVSVLV